MNLFPGIFIGVLGLIAILWPLFTRPSHEESPEDRVSTLIEQKNILLQQIAELDFEYQLQRISNEDYQQARKQLKQDTLRIMLALDPSLKVGPDKAKTAGEELEAELEQVKKQSDRT